MAKRGRPTKTESILRSMKSKPEPKTPIATEMYLPNLSGIASHPEAKKNFVPYNNANADIDIGTHNFTTTGNIYASGYLYFNDSNVSISELGTDVLWLHGSNGIFIDAGTPDYFIVEVSDSQIIFDGDEFYTTFNGVNLGKSTDKWGNLYLAGDAFIDTLTFSGGSITDSTGTIDFANENLTTTGKGSYGELLIEGASGLDGATPITLTLKSTNDGSWTDGAKAAMIDFATADTSANPGTMGRIALVEENTSGKDYALVFYTTTYGSGAMKEHLRIDNNGKLKIKSSNATDSIIISHNNTDAYFQWNDGSLHFVTDEATNTDTKIAIEGKGTGRAWCQIYDQDSLEHLGLTCSYGTAYVYAAGTNPQGLDFQYSADAPIIMFSGATEGETQELKIYGYKTGDAKRSMEIGVGIDANDTASFDGLSEYRFDGIVRANTGFNINGTAGVTGTFTTTDGKTVTVTNGIITSIV